MTNGEYLVWAGVAISLALLIAVVVWPMPKEKESDAAQRARDFGKIPRWRE